MEHNNNLTSAGSSEKQAVQTDELPGKIKSIEKSWFWITLLSLINLYYTVSATTHYFNMATETNYLAPTIGFTFVTAAACVFLVPLLFKRLGILDDAFRFRIWFILLSGLGIVSIILFAVICNTIVPEIMWPAIIFQFISVAIPAITAGCALHRFIKTVSVKRSVLLSGLIIIIMSLLLIVHMTYMLAFNEWRSIEISYITVYIVLLIIPVLLLIKNKDSFEYSPQSNSEYFPESMYIKFMILAVIMITLDTFHNNAYYDGGDYDNFGWGFSYVIMFLPMLTTILFTVLLRRNKWLPVILACTLAICFQQGLILFFNNSEQLALMYALADTLSGNGPSTFLLFFPLMFCVQRRKDAFSAAGMLSLWFLANALTKFISENPGHSYSVLVAPAVTFTLSIGTIAFLFYLHSEYNRVYYNTLISDIRSQLSKETLSSDEAMAEAGFTEDERKVTLLLIEGETRYGISRKLHRPVAEISRDMDSIREKVISKSDPDPGIAAAVRAFDLTRRETDTLRCLCRNMTNVDIAAELIISEETVKKHVRSLMKKLPVEDRKDVAAWAESLAGAAHKTDGGERE